MAVSDVQIAKLALQHVGDRFDITDLSEASTEAEQVNLVFDVLRDALLREHPWNFALKYVTPSSLVGTPPAQWAYMFAYPADALRVWKIVNPLDPDGTSLPPLRFRVRRNSSDVKVLLTNEDQPEFEYSAQITNTLQFDHAFDLALSWRIAQTIALPLTGDTEVRDRMIREGEKYIAAAKTDDGNEGISREHNQDPDWIRARN